MTLWMSNDWPIMIGGKPFSSIPPYTIIAFELTILFGGLMTVLGLFTMGKLPYRFKASTPSTTSVSRPRTSASPCAAARRDVAEVDALMREHGAVEVELVEP